MSFIVALTLLCSVMTSYSSVICPDAETECPDSSTCCLMSNNKYGCCPLPNATCCSDKTHCCPNGFSCDPTSQTCYRGKERILMSLKVSARPKSFNGVLCPDGQSECPDGSTCCRLSSGQYGCCPLPKAVCCSDHIHCCPNGYTCDTSGGTCNKGLSIVPMVKKLQSKPLKGVICPDGTSECPDGSTCCILSSGQYGCCPLPNAVCCSDHIHCCPNGYTCDTSGGTCNKGLSVVPMVKKLKAKNLRSVTCPDETSECPDGNTCCKLSSGQYGCCPLPNAVCCSDHIHCCPNGYTCDTSGGTCNKGLSVVPMVTKLKAKKLRSVTCPDGTSECPDGSTCCKLSSGQYGCCPLPKAVCCSDNVHCCPSGYTCDTGAGICTKGSSMIAMMRKVNSRKIVKKTFNRDCPDQSQCLYYETCCLMESGCYGCCPLPNAVCCPDHQHCCPNGYNCDKYSNTCYASAKIIPWIPHRPSEQKIHSDGSVKCKDGSECNSGETCCETTSKKYACCPLPSAVCCSDKEHCCPAGYTCDEQGNKCTRGARVVPMVAKSPSRNPLKFKSVPIKVSPTPTVVDSVVRFVPNDSKDECNCGLYKTCCNVSKGQTYCCPLPNASCCSDGRHCCPQGFTCDSSKGCIKK
ncbi:progranulin isoform X2 [Exaiptasia diaphana]|uniref:Granulins domain-containing protein n=1 Tax=Exaiptasia diaphana TaxID=2652724 RepID=A0A913XMX2_EXADI|nr:progranulin isoform X2 [Exaiptasia diaphana]